MSARSHLHVEGDATFHANVTGATAWLSCDSVSIHVYTPEAADRLAEAARELAAKMRLREPPKRIATAV